VESASSHALLHLELSLAVIEENGEAVDSFGYPWSGVRVLQRRLYLLLDVAKDPLERSFRSRHVDAVNTGLGPGGFQAMDRA